jgi:peptide deformylase
MLAIILTMPIRDLIYANDRRLRQQAGDIEKFSPELSQLVSDMIETMQAHNGFGLAAPQIGVMDRVFVAHIPLPEQEDDPPAHPEAGKVFVLINPEIIDSGANHVKGEEGCLSIPGWRGWVNRPEWVTIKAISLDGEPFQLRVEGLLARIIMHETDHLNGVLFIDHVEDLSKLWQVDDEADHVMALESILTAQSS